MTDFVRFLFLVLSSSQTIGILAGVKPPEIKVLAWVEGDNGGWRNDVVIGDQDEESPVILTSQNTYILTNEVVLIFFLCTAPYPMQWDFSNSKWMATHKKSLGGLIMNSRRLSSDINNPKTFTYWSQIGLYGDSNLFNGNYICKNADDDSVQSNITVFWEGGPLDNEFVLSGTNLTIGTDRSDKIIFPCFVRNPYAEAVLLQDSPLTVNNTVNDTWTDVTSTPNLVFKPEIGFVFQKVPTNEWMDPGLYKCALKDGTDSVLLNYVMKYEDQSSLVINGPVRAPASLKKTKANKYGISGFECCSSSGKPPRVSLWSCENPSMCKMIQPAIKYEIQREVTGFLGIVQTNGSCASFYGGWNFLMSDLLLIHCVGDGIDTVQEYFTREPQNVSYINWDKQYLQNWLQISPAGYINKPSKDDKYDIYAGESKSFTCRLPAYFFSYGIRWTIKFKDGTVETLRDTFEDEKPTPILVLLPTKTIAASVTINGTKEMDTLTCHAPVWNSTDWVTKTIQFSAKVSNPPLIDNPETETLYWGLNETDKTLVCKNSGDPKPEVIWTKDGKANSNLLYNVSKHHDDLYYYNTLKISRVTHEDMGEFKCTAINFAGRSEKTFVVFVEESHVAEITTTVIAALVVLLLIVGGIIIVRKTILQKKSLDNLRESVYRPDESA